MNFKYLMMTAALFALGCSSSNEKKDAALTDSAATYTSAVPHDTPYTMAAVDPIPVGLILDKVAGITNTYTELLNSIEPMVNDPSSSDDERKVFAVMRELGDLFTREGMERSGLSMNPRSVVWGLGILPAMKMDIADAEKFKAFITRLETAAGMTAIDAKLGQYEYKVHTVDELMIPYAVQGNTFVFGVTLEKTAALYLPYLLGEKKPERSLNDSNSLEILKQKYGFLGVGIGFLDLQRVVSILAREGDDIHVQITQALMTNAPPVETVCVNEFKAIAANYPRIILGYEKFDETGMRVTMGHEMTNGFGGMLAGTKTSIPGYDTEFSKESMFKAGFGFNVGALSQVVIGKAAEVANAPYQCPDLMGLNEVAGQIAAAGMFLPPVISQIEGGSLVVKDVQIPEESAVPQGPDGSMAGPTTDPLVANAVAMIASADAPTLFESIKMMAPELAQFIIASDGVPVRIDAESVTQNVKDVYLALRPNRIGVSVGEGNQNIMADALQSTSTTATPWASLTYDIKKFGELVAGSEPELQTLKTIFDQGVLVVDLNPTEDGIFVTYDQAFAP